MKLGQLIDYNMRNIFLQKSYTKCGAEISPRLFSGKWKLSLSLYAKPTYEGYEGYQNILKLACIPLAFT